MASQVRNDNWKYDEDLRQDLEKYIKQNLKRKEILDFVAEKYPMYAWSLRTLCRRLNHFELKYMDHEVDLDDVEAAVTAELNGPGRLLGYRALHKKIREIHGLKVPRDIVYAMMAEVDPSGLEQRNRVGKRRRTHPKGAFESKGSDWTMSLDGHDKLCGFQNATFPLCVYGGLDTYSGRVQFLRISTSNSNPKIIGRYYLDYLYESRVLPCRLRLDKGTETVDMATMHLYLLSKYGDEADVDDSVMYGPSTENKIERFWKELLERLETFFKDQLSKLLEDGDYDREDPLHRDLLAFVYVPVLQKELDIFRETVWNSHRGRKQAKKQLPTGVPEHIYCFPEQYGGQKCGHILVEQDLMEVAEASGILDGTDDFLDPALRTQCEAIIPDTSEIEPKEAANAYLYLKSKITL